MIVEEGRPLCNLMTSVDLKPIRAGIVQRPEDYRWNSLVYHTQTKK